MHSMKMKISMLNQLCTLSLELALKIRKHVRVTIIEPDEFATQIKLEYKYAFISLICKNLLLKMGSPYKCIVFI